jgi:hypothetical protein
MVALTLPHKGRVLRQACVPFPDEIVYSGAITFVYTAGRMAHD